MSVQKKMNKVRAYEDRARGIRRHGKYTSVFEMVLITFGLVK